jgi:hypothetical protein
MITVLSVCLSPVTEEIQIDKVTPSFSLLSGTRSAADCTLWAVLGSSKQLKWEVLERREKASSAGSSRRHCWSEGGGGAECDDMAWHL